MTATTVQTVPTGLTPVRMDRKTVLPWLPDLTEWLLHGAFYGLEHTWPAVFRSDGRADYYGLMDGELLAGFIARRDVQLIGLSCDGRPSQVTAALIGSVATRPEYRGRGIAAWLLEQSCTDAERDGCTCALLWAERPGVYARCGFMDAGAQDVVALRLPPDMPVPLGCEEVVLPETPESPGGVVRLATVQDRRRLLPLHEAKPWRVARSESEMDLLLSTPGATTYVLDRDGELLAYASQGKGADLSGWWHEVGGSDAAVAHLLPVAMQLTGQLESLLQLPPYRVELPDLLGEMVLERCAVPVAMQRLFRPDREVELFVDGFDSI